jgi:hypothetical protein
MTFVPNSGRRGRSRPVCRLIFSPLRLALGIIQVVDSVLLPSG